MAQAALIKASAPGKLLVLGEYAVLRGAPAIVMAVDCRARVSLRPSQHRTWRLTASQLNLHDYPLDQCGQARADTVDTLRQKLKLFSAVVECVRMQLGELAPCDVSIDTADFFHNGTKLGIGSSAAVAVALTGALAHSLDCQAGHESAQLLSSAQLFELAAKAHHKAQGGVGSNVDIAASVYGGTIVHRIRQNPVPVRLPDALHIQPIFTGGSASTPNLVAQVLKSRAAANTKLEQHFQHMTHLAQAGWQACTDNNAAALGHHAGEYHLAMQQLGALTGADIISSDHQQLRALAEQAGLHYKPSGAGGGDIGLLFSQGRDDISLLPKLQAAGFEPLKLAQCASGFQLL